MVTSSPRRSSVVLNVSSITSVQTFAMQSNQVNECPQYEFSGPTASISCAQRPGLPSPSESLPCQGSSCGYLEKVRIKEAVMEDGKSQASSREHEVIEMFWIN